MMLTSDDWRQLPGASQLKC
jgi:hypothetical protein